MRIVQLANFVTATSGGIRTTLAALGAGYVEAGHEVVEMVAGRDHLDEVLDDGRVRRTVPGVPLPGGAGYRLMIDRSVVRAGLAALAPDAVEVHDRLTLPWVARWAHDRDLPATVVVHERLAGELAGWLGLPHAVAVPTAWPLDRRLLDRVGHVVVASRYAAAAFGRDPRVEVVPFGVDLDRFRVPARGTEGDGADDVLRLVHVGRLSREKRPEDALATLVELCARGRPAHLDVLGDGPLRRRMEARARGLPVRFHGHVPTAVVADRVAAADVLLAPCRVESYGLAALEALACGTSIVVPDRGALPELFGTRRHTGAAGAMVGPGARPAADAVEALAGLPRAHRRAAARAIAERRPWTVAVDRLLAAHTGRKAALRAVPGATAAVP